MSSDLAKWRRDGTGSSFAGASFKTDFDVAPFLLSTGAIPDVRDEQHAGRSKDRYRRDRIFGETSADDLRKNMVCHVYRRC